ARSVQFRTSAGYVFEAYVGKLLQGSERNFAVHPERAYVKSGQEHLTPDWIVLENGRLVVVEAKFHGLVLEAKLSGAPSPDDLEKLARGCNQLLAFKTALLEEYEELRDYQNADGVELVLVTYDDIPSPNFAVAKALTDLGVRDIDQITICSIYDLE